MATGLIEKKRFLKTRQFDVATGNVPRLQRRVSSRPRPVRLPKENEDAKTLAFLAKAVFWMAVIAMAPLVLFHMILYFSPDLFLIPITPN